MKTYKSLKSFLALSLLTFATVKPAIGDIVDDTLHTAGDIVDGTAKVTGDVINTPGEIIGNAAEIEEEDDEAVAAPSNNKAKLELGEDDEEFDDLDDEDLDIEEIDLEDDEFED